MKAFSLLFLFFSSYSIMIAQINISETKCICPDSSGRIIISANGDAGPFIATWTGPGGYVSSGLIATDIVNPGMYEAEVINNYGCSTFLTQEISLCNVIGLDSTIISPSCTDQNTGQIELFLSDDPNLYQYQWSNGDTTHLIQNLASGEYCVTISKDNNTCDLSSCFNVGVEDELALAADISPACNGSDGMIDLTALGSSDYSFQWSNGAVTEDITGLTAGTYSVTVTSSAGCTIEDSFTVGSGSPITVTPTIQAPICRFIADGVISLDVQGDQPLTYEWSNGATTAELTDLLNGNYCVTITSATGCTWEDCFDLQPIAGESQLPFVEKVEIFSDGLSNEVKLYDAEWIKTSNNCWVLTGGMLPFPQTVYDAMAAGTVGLRVEATTNRLMSNINLRKPNGGFVVMNNINNSNKWFTDLFAIDIAPFTNSGNTFNYILGFTGTDLNGLELVPMHVLGECADIPAMDINCNINPSLPTDAPNLDETHILERECIEVNIVNFNVNTQTAEAEVEGGVPPYTYDWFPVDPNGQIPNPNNLANVSFPSPADYCVRVSDSQGCVVTACIGECDIFSSLDGLVSVVDEDCNPNNGNGQVCLNLNFPATINWLGTSFTSTCVPMYTGISGTYCVEITNLNCNKTFTACINGLPTNGPPEPIVINQISGSPSCYDTNTGVDLAQGSLCVDVTGGTPPYSYTWDGIPGNSTTCRTNLKFNTCYYVTVTDACGTTANQCMQIPNFGGFSISSVNISDACGSQSNTGSITIGDIIGEATPPYSFAWSGPNGFVATSQNIENITAGTYNVTVTDACGQIQNFNYTVGSFTTADIEITDVDISPYCHFSDKGAIDLTVSSSESLSYNWSNGAATEDISDLDVGTYTVTITAAGGCQSYGSYTIVSGSFDFTIDKTNTCPGENTGSISFPSLWGNVAGMTYSWSNGATSASINNLAADTYSCTLTNGVGCSKVAFVTVYEFAEPTIVLEQLQHSAPNVITLEDREQGFIDIDVTGGYAANELTYSWSNGANTQDIYSLAAGTYTVTVTSPDGCTTQASFEILLCSNTDALVIDFLPPLDNGAGSVTTPITNGVGTIEVSIINGTPPYSYEWECLLPSNCSNQVLANTNPVQIAFAGTYRVTVTDACGSMQVADISMEKVEDCPNANLDLSHINSCLDENEGYMGVRFRSISGFFTNDMELGLNWQIGNEDSIGLVTLNENGGVKFIHFGSDQVPTTGAPIRLKATTENGCVYEAARTFSNNLFSVEFLRWSEKEFIWQYSQQYSNFVWWDQHDIQCTCGWEIDITNGKVSYFANEGDVGANDKDSDCPGDTGRRDLKFSPYYSVNDPPVGTNICELGGIIYSGNLNTGANTIATVIPNSGGEYLTPSPDRKGCLFPPEALIYQNDIYDGHASQYGTSHPDLFLYALETIDTIVIQNDTTSQDSSFISSVSCPNDCATCDIYQSDLEWTLVDGELDCPTVNVYCVDDDGNYDGTPLGSAYTGYDCYCDQITLAANGGLDISGIDLDDPNVNVDSIFAYIDNNPDQLYCRTILVCEYEPCIPVPGSDGDPFSLIAVEQDCNELGIPPCNDPSSITADCPLCPTASPGGPLVPDVPLPDEKIVATQKVDLSTGILDMKVAPNPFENSINVSITANIETSETELFVSNSIGKIVAVFPITVYPGRNNFELQFSSYNLPPGIYYLMLEDKLSKKRWFTKIVKS